MSGKFASSAYAVCFLTLGLVARPIRAATPTASLGVTATVQAGCVVSATASAYRAYDAQVANAASTVSITCTNATSYVVDLHPGSVSGATMPLRKMTGPLSAWVGYEPVSHSSEIANWNQTVDIDSTVKTGSGFSGMGSIHNWIARTHYVAADGFGNFVTIAVTY
jgi:spore coat protein U-like protein